MASCMECIHFNPCNSNKSIVVKKQTEGNDWGLHNSVENECKYFTPTTDVVEVVRCKDCKFWTPMDNGISWHHQGRTDGQCEKLWQLHCAERHLTNQDHFCSYGERKE